jgi:hypothetical protein
VWYEFIKQYTQDEKRQLCQELEVPGPTSVIACGADIMTPKPTVS